MNVTDLLLYEGIEDYWASGSSDVKLDSCIIKIITALELLFKEELAYRHPQLIQRQISPLSLSQIVEFAEGAIEVEIPTTSDKSVYFEDALKRAGQFIDISSYEREKLVELYKIRNGLIHSHEIWTEEEEDKIDETLLEVVFPFIKRWVHETQCTEIGINRRNRRLKDIEFDEDIWNALDSLRGKNDIDLKVRKSLIKHQFFLKRLNQELEEAEVVADESIWCPSCEQETLSHVLGVDVEAARGEIESVDVYRKMQCSNCKLLLEREEITHIEDNIDAFVPANAQQGWLDLQR